MCLVNYYQKLYLDVDFSVAQIAFRSYRRFIDRKHRVKCKNRRGLEEIANDQKTLASEKFFHNYKKSGSKLIESGDFLVLEFFKVVLPLETSLLFKIYCCCIL